jgi:trehalose 6-phosphate synthase
MRLSLRLIVSLIVGVTLLSAVFAIFQQKAEKRGLRNDMGKRAEILAESLAANVEPLLAKSSHSNLQKIVTQFGNRERVTGIAVFDKSANTLAVTPGLQSYLYSEMGTISRVIAEDASYGGFITLNENPAYLYVLPLHGESGVAGALAIFHDASFIDRQTARIRQETYLRILAQTLFIALTTLLIIRWSLLRPIARTAKWIRDLRDGKRVPRPNLAEGDLFKPLAQEVRHLADSLEAARAAAEEEARLRESAESLWTPERLRVHVRSKLGDRPLFVVSNREPYMHTYRGKTVEVVVPASGVVTAIEPILRTCKGTWLAHGSGDADRENVDERDCLQVPPDNPQYTLKRVWLSKEEEEGYYFGFSNEGLWPLCHIAHTRPTFRAKDWEQYQAVNRKFGQALIEEMKGAEEPCVLLQDYHFALLPRLVKKQRPDARLAIFWHIPWPNPEAFGICPWQRELLDGLLGADLVGFHTQAHCNNFLQTVDGALESRVNWERFSVERGGHVTQVRPFPISVAFAGTGEPEPPLGGSPYLARGALLREHGVEATFMGIGVERVDYTKGIIERFRGLERFLEKYPGYRGRFCLVQIGEPSRTHIKRYHDLLGEVEAEAGRINWRFQTNHWRPIVYLPWHHSHQEIQRYYKAADLCLVTSLHDGMNLVSKEFIAARDDDQGALILSQFAGASHQLRDALIVNPYDTEQLADAMHFALEMDPSERSARMHRLRQVVKEFNIYRWAADLISGLSEIRLEPGSDAEPGRHESRAPAKLIPDTAPNEGEISARRELAGY